MNHLDAIKAMNDLVDLESWNSLEGSVARWNSNRTEMVKTAFQQEDINAVSVQNSVSQAIPNAAPDQYGYEHQAPSGTGFSFPDLGKPSLDISPAQQRLVTARRNSVMVYRQLWSRIIPARSQTKTSIEPSLNMAINNEPKFVPLTNSVPDVSVLSSLLKPAPQLDNGYDYSMENQFKPGESLSAPEQISTENISQIGITQRISTVYTDSSHKAGRLMDRFVGGPFSDENPNRRANLLIFAAILIILIMVISLIRPIPSRTSQRINKLAR